jgi:general stress protein YciG
MPENKNQNQGDKSERGFAAMDEEQQKEISSKGGKAAHQAGTANEFTSEEAAEAGKKGGKASGGNQGGNQSSGGGNQSSEEMSERGRKGGEK